MSWVLHRYQDQIALKAASDMAPLSIVAKDGSVVEQVVAIGTNNIRPLGLVDASALQAERVTVYEEVQYVKARAGATVAANAELSVATFGRVGPAAGASGVGVWAVGEAMEAGNPGDIITIRVNPRQVSGLV